MRALRRTEFWNERQKPLALDVPDLSAAPAGTKPILSGNEPLYVTRPYLPPLAEIMPMIEQIWATRILTNDGPLHQRFEAAVADYLGAPHVSLVTNGTIALTVALEVLKIEGEVITTPYSFVATSHALAMQHIAPVFVDIKADDFNLDPARIEAAITPRTRAIMPVHCYGNPCDAAAIQDIADRHGLKVIYDAAHAFGVAKNGESVFAHGDFSTLSFHATKAFNTFEGGAIVSRTAAGKTAVDRLRNFGFQDEVTVDTLGFNAKMSELNAAVGLIQLSHFERVRAARGAVDARYRAALADVPGITCPPLPGGVPANPSYFPLLVGPEYPLSRDGLYDRLRTRNIFPRRYFYPLLTNFPMYSGLASAAPANLPVATAIAERILCLPIHPDLTEEDQARVIDGIRAA